MTKAQILITIGIKYDLRVWKGDSLKRSAPLSEVEWVGDGFRRIDHPHPDKGNRDEAATQLQAYNLQIQA